MQERGIRRRRFIIIEVSFESGVRSLNELLNEPPDVTSYEDSRVVENLRNRAIDRRYFYRPTPEEFTMPNFNIEFHNQGPDDEYIIDPIEVIIVVCCIYACLFILVFWAPHESNFRQSSVA
nr:hypothetical protein HmN_000503800 [Hymenolepis microstoma]